MDKDFIDPQNNGEENETEITSLTIADTNRSVERVSDETEIVTVSADEVKPAVLDASQTHLSSDEGGAMEEYIPESEYAPDPKLIEGDVPEVEIRDVPNEDEDNESEPKETIIEVEVRDVKRSKKGLVIAIAAALAAACLIFGLGWHIHGRSDKKTAPSESAAPEAEQSAEPKISIPEDEAPETITELLPNARKCELVEYDGYSVPQGFTARNAIPGGKVYMPYGTDMADMNDGSEYVLIAYSDMTNEELDTLFQNALGAMSKNMKSGDDIPEPPSYSDSNGIGDYFKKYMEWLNSAAEKQGKKLPQNVKIGDTYFRLANDEFYQEVRMVSFNDKEAFLSIDIKTDGYEQINEYRFIGKNDTVRNLFVICKDTEAGKFTKEKREAEYALAMFR